MEVPTNNPLATKWGSTQTFYLKDGLNQGNNIAVFPTQVQGICAQLDLWHTSKNYKDKTFANAIAIWSGGNYVEDYIAFVLKRVPGMTRITVMDDAFWRGPMCIPFLKAQAWHEAGKQYPAAETDWTEAQRIVMGGAAPVAPAAPKPAPTPKPQPAPAPTNTPRNATTGTTLVATIAAAMQAHKVEIAIGIVVAGIAIALAVHFLWPKKKD